VINDLKCYRCGEWPCECADGCCIVHGDCFDFLNGLWPTAVVTDPPYGIGLKNNDRDGHRSNRSFDVAGDCSQEAGQNLLDWAEKRGYTTIAFASPFKPWNGKWRNIIAWDKGVAVGGGGDIKKCLKRTFELIQVARNGHMQGNRDGSVWRFPMIPSDSVDHICAKPVPLVIALLERFVDPRHQILDPFMGSGTTLIAAKRLGRKCIGIEIEEKYCEIAANRLDSEPSPLFKEPLEVA